MTSGHNLKAKYIIHTVGPVYSGKHQDQEDLRSCYINSLRLADENGITSVSFPAISTGAFSYPMKEAAEISLSAVEEYLKGETTLKLVRIVLYSRPTYEAYSESLKAL